MLGRIDCYNTLRLYYYFLHESLYRTLANGEKVTLCRVKFLLKFSHAVTCFSPVFLFNWSFIIVHEQRSRRSNFNCSVFDLRVRRKQQINFSFLSSMLLTVNLISPENI